MNSWINGQEMMNSWINGHEMMDSWIVVEWHSVIGSTEEIPAVFQWLRDFVGADMWDFSWAHDSFYFEDEDDAIKFKMRWL